MASTGGIPMGTEGPAQPHPIIPLPDIGRRWMEEARGLHLADPAASLLLSHCGAVDHGTMMHLIREAERTALLKEEPSSVRKRVVNVLIEALDNLQRHGMDLLRDASCFLLVHDRLGYLVVTANAVPSATAALLQHRVGIINEMDPEDLKEHYLKLLANNALSANGGSGLGLLTMARRCMLPIVARTSPLGPYTAFLSFEMRIGGDEDPYDAVA